MIISFTCILLHLSAFNFTLFDVTFYTMIHSGTVNAKQDKQEAAGLYKVGTVYLQYR
jgi:hypothetical protein